MNRILIDTSVWIDFFNSTNLSPETEILRQLITDNQSIYLCPIIYQEILQGIRNDQTFEYIREILLDFEMIDFTWMETTDKAIEIYRTLRKKGITIRKSNDCLIAAYAILADVRILYKDRDFTQIAKGYNLKIFQL
ncbi:MAG: PIN domain-containing protein [Tannerella sp.]|jgi:predicted nucleic acid-binding protein|nr:PIN domain-containing protein [Tannerella sp.]